MNLISYLAACFLYILPVLAAGVVFIFTYKRKFFDFLNFPVSESLFGRNKTWRGFVLMPVYCFAAVWLAGIFLGPANEVFAAGNLFTSLLLGFFYPFGELPNSFIKRKLGIGPGGRADKKGQAALFFAFDNVDSVVACCVCLALVYRINQNYLPGILVLGSFFHLSTDMLMVRLKLKRPQWER